METYTWYVRRPDGYHLLFPSEETPDGMGASHYPAVGQRDPAQAPPAQAPPALRRPMETPNTCGSQVRHLLGPLRPKDWPTKPVGRGPRADDTPIAPRMGGSSSGSSCLLEQDLWPCHEQSAHILPRKCECCSCSVYVLLCWHMV
jgi:hypothetical protein